MENKKDFLQAATIKINEAYVTAFKNTRIEFSVFPCAFDKITIIKSAWKKYDLLKIFQKNLSI